MGKLRNKAAKGSLVSRPKASEDDWTFSNTAPGEWMIHTVNGQPVGTAQTEYDANIMSMSKAMYHELARMVELYRRGRFEIMDHNGVAVDSAIAEARRLVSLAVRPGQRAKGVGGRFVKGCKFGKGPQSSG